MIRRAIYTAALVALATPAHADWQYTKWGMTPAQVVAASKGKATAGAGEPGDRMEGSPLQVGAVGTHSSGKWQFKSKFYFDAGKLGLVKLDLVNGEKGCGALWADMKSAYGKPFSDDENVITHLAIWHDTAKNNRIALFAIGQSSCSIDYKPLKSDDNSGL
jgi:hypothetical protein